MSKILLVEDDDFSRQVGSNVLQGLGIDFIVAEDGLQSVDIYTKNSKDIKLILMDLQMPNLDGYGATTQIRKIQSKNGLSCKIYGCSADDDEETLEKCLESGMDSLLKKPLRKNILQQVL